MGRRNRIISGIKIHGIADKGMAVGKTEDGKIVFAEGAVPGDIIEFKVQRKKKGYMQGYATQILEYSLLRTDPICQHFEDCGGCKWQNLQYSEQLIQKQSIVEKAIEKIAGIQLTTSEEKLRPNIEPIIGMENPFAYRNKMEFSFSNKRWITFEETKTDTPSNQSDALGLHRPRSYAKIVDIQQCHLVTPIVDEIKNELRNFTLKHSYSYFDIKEQSGLMRGVVIRVNQRQEILFMPVFFYRDKEKIGHLMQHMCNRFPAIVSAYFMVNEKKNDTLFDIDAEHYSGDLHLEESLGHIKYHIGPKSFFQTNTQQGTRLYNLIREYADLQGHENVYDLYTGLGSIALYIADSCHKVVGIEEISEAIQDAQSNAKLNQVNNVEYIVGDVRDILNPAFIAQHKAPDVIITDPPRAGMHADVVEVLLKSSAEKIIYVSCKPSTMARDIKILSEIYELIRLTPVDMFPHTNHVECVSLLIKKK